MNKRHISEMKLGEVLRLRSGHTVELEHVEPVTCGLADFFNTVPHKTTKTTEKYRLLSGTLTLKKGGVKAKQDDAKLVPWLKANGYGNLVKVEESAKWGELKKLLTYTGEIATIESTGEIVEGVTAYDAPDTFTVDI